MQPDNSIRTTSHKAWIENGILYHEYEEELTLTGILEVEKKSLGLLSEHDIHLIPIVVCLKHIDKTRFKLTIADYARVLSTFDLARHASSIWLVGVEEEVKHTIITIGGYFLVKRIYFAEDLKEAEEAARLLTSSAESIFDPE